MKLSFSSKVILRQPFQMERLPLLAKIYIQAYSQRPGRFHKFVRRPLTRFLFRLLKSSLGKHNGLFTYLNRDKNATISFRAGNTQFHSLYLPEYSYYEPETLALIDILLTRKDVFYDVGSNWGHFTLHAASNPAFQGEIHAFEPMPSTFMDLESTVKQALLIPQVQLHCLALSDSSSDTFITIPDGIHSGNAMLSEKDSGVKIKRARLDELPLPPPALMKVDAEGHEATIFSGAHKTIESNKPFILFENFRNMESPESMLAPMRVLKDLGYVFFLPLFVSDHQGAPVHAGKQDSVPSSAPDAVLGLFEFKMEERCFLDEQINILACHQNRLNILESRFTGLGN